MTGLDHIVSAALAGVLNSLWIGAALAATVWLLARFFPRTNAATRYLLWWAVLALLVLLPFGGIGLHVSRRPVAAAVRSVPIPTIKMTAPAVYAPVRPFQRSLLPLQIPSGRWVAAATMLWLAFAMLHFLRIAWSYLYLRGVKRRAHPAPEPVQRSFQAWVTECSIRRPVQVLVSAKITSPMATGFWHPAVILPEGLPAQFQGRELDHVLLHELAHVARRDDWGNLAARSLGALVGLHPIAAWVLRQVGRERELACDDWVVSMTGEARPYAASLARLFEICGSRYRTLLAAGMAESASHLGDRIEILLDRRRQFAPRASLVRAGLTVMALAVLVVAGLRAPRWVVLAQTAPPPSAKIFRGPVPVRNSHGSLLAALVAAGYGYLSVDEIISLKEHGVTAEFLEGIKESGWSKMTAGELVELRSRGVSPEFLRAAHDAGYQKTSIHDVVAMKERGVRLDAMAEIHGLGFGPYTPAQAIDLATHGVPREFFRAARDAGFKKLEANEAIDAYVRGVRPDTFRAAADYGSHLTLQQIVKLRQAGVIR